MSQNKSTKKPGKQFQQKREQSQQKINRNNPSWVPMLTYGPESNLLAWSKRIEKVGSVKYGPLASNICRLGDYGLPEDINPEDYDLENPAHLVQFKSAVRQYDKEMAKIVDNKVHFYYFMDTHMSLESQEAIKRRQDYGEFHGRCPLALWNAIKETHGVNEAYQDEVMMRMDLRKKMKKCRQSDFETITEYHERYSHLVSCVNDIQEEELNEADVAMDFFDNLNDRMYSEFKAQFINDVNQGKIDTPASLADMFSMASKYVPTTKPMKSGMNAAFSTRVDEDEPDGGWQKQEKKSDKKRNKQQNSKNQDDRDDAKSDSSAKKDGIQCFNCSGYGHYASECPSKKRANVKLTCATLQKKYRWFHVLLDNQADRSIVHPKLLSDLRPTVASVTGITGDTIDVNKKGMLNHFFECLASEDTGVGVLSFAEVEQVHKVTYVRQKAFVVHLPHRDLWFRKKNNLYVANMRDWSNLDYQTTVCGAVTRSQRDRFTPKEVKLAEKAYKFMIDAGITSERDAINLVRDGNVKGIDFTAQDIRNAMNIFGQNPSFYRGKMTQRAVKRAPIEPDLKFSNLKHQHLTSDIMFVGEKKYLLSLANPLELLIVSPLTRTTKSTLAGGFQSQINLLKSRGFKVVTVFMDPQPGHMSFHGAIADVEFNIGGAGDHADKIDQKIRRVKELIRSVHSGLPWNMPRMLLNDIVLYAVNRLNMRRSASSQGDVSAPKVRFTGRKPDFNKEFGIGFGDYVECYKPGVVSRDALADRSEPCIALYPLNNGSGSWMMFNLKTRRRVRRSNWRRMNTSQLIVDTMNGIATDEKSGNLVLDDTQDQEPRVDHDEQKENDPVVHQVNNDNVDNDETTGVTGANVVVDNDDVSVADVAENSTDVYDEDTLADGDDHDDDVDDSQSQISVEIDQNDDQDMVDQGPGETCMISHLTVKKGVAKFGKSAKDAVWNELDQLINVKKAIRPVHLSQLSQEEKRNIIRSFMFLTAKYDATGRFEKIKARLVADGSQQSERPKSETASPTVAMESVFMCLSIAAKEKRKLATADIGGAYLNAEMTGEIIHIELDPQMSSIVKEKCPEIEHYINKHGKLFAKLDKALYGCVQSALLWNKHISDYLESLGFVKNEVDDCVWNTVINGKQLTLILFVDDVLVTCEHDAGLKWIIDKLKERYENIKSSDGNVLSYLGMQIKWGQSPNHEISVDTCYYLETVLQEYEVSGTATSPAGNNMFNVVENGFLSDSERRNFHTIVAKLLYIANRTRPDIMLAISYLTTRVRNPTQDDFVKLNRVLKYLNGSRDHVMYFRGAEDMIECYVDAAFAQHQDGKSHTGMILKVYGDTVLVKSSKQKIITKDSTEAELVGSSDKVLFALKCHEFMIAQGQSIGIPVVYQDNTSTITLITQGGGKFRNKYMRVRQHVLLDLVKKKDVCVRYVTTKDMIADICTKPLQGDHFRFLVSRMLGKTGV